MLTYKGRDTFCIIVMLGKKNLVFALFSCVTRIKILSLMRQVIFRISVFRFSTGVKNLAEKLFIPYGVNYRNFRQYPIV